MARLDKNIHDNETYISLGKFHSNIANLFQKPKMDGNRIYKNDPLAINYYKEVFTDEATVVEAFGMTIHLVEGEENNFKITLPVDLELAERLMG